ncbi:MAG: cupin domain-containing protein [Gemmatimonadota bacterium]|nr:cupin domain-containing protein [Gemmatimonadota bacterium]
MDAEQVITLLGLKPHETEGGFFCETYRSTDTLAPGTPGKLYESSRNISTAIYYLLTPDTFSAMHRLQSDEIFHLYLGGPVTVVLLYPEGHGEIKTLGCDIPAGQEPQLVVPRRVWQGLMIEQPGSFALMGTTVAPGFDFRDFELGGCESLCRQYPRFSAMIERLTDENLNLHHPMPQP